MIETFEQECSGCGRRIELQWDNGLVYDREHITLVADWVYHNECWDKLVESNPP